MDKMPYTGGLVSTPGLFGLEIVFQTVSTTGATYFTQDRDSGTWKFLGMDTGVRYTEYPYVSVQNSVSASETNYLGYWAFYASPNGLKIWSGIAGPNITTKKSGVMYIQV